MKRSVVFIGFLLAGCSSQHFICEKDLFKFDDSENVTQISCGFPVFEFSCDKRTFIQISNKYECSTVDDRKFVVIGNEDKNLRDCERQLGDNASLKYVYNASSDPVGVECECGYNSTKEDGKCVGWNELCNSYGNGVVPDYGRGFPECECDNGYYLTPSRSECLPNNMGGIGVVLHQDENGEIKVSEVLQNSPAYFTIDEGSIILKIDQEEISGKSLQEVSKALRGLVDTEVSVTFREPDKSIPETKIFKRVQLNIQSLQF